MFNSQGHIVTGSLWVEEPAHTIWARFCTVNHGASVSNYQLSHMKHPGQDSNRQPQKLKASTQTATPPSPPASIERENWYSTDLHQGPDSRKVSSLSQISAEILLKSEILVSAEILLKLRFMKGISAETKISDKFCVWTNQN